MAVGITALGTYAPQRVLTNKELEQLLDTTDEWIVSRTGIRQRHVAAEDEFASTMGIRAVQDLVRRHPDALAGVDLIVCATSSPDALFPATAALIGGEVGLTGVGAYDLLCACSGFVYACATAHGFVAAGIARKVLVVGAETLSKIVDWEDRGSCILFGDGAGAAVVEAVPDGYGFQSYALGADSAGGASLYMRCVADRIPGLEKSLKPPKLGMNGREVFRFAVRVLVDSGQEALTKAGLTPADVDWLIPHQANARIIDAARERFGLPPEKVVVNVAEYGNTSTASIPLALQEAVDDGRVKDGDQLLFVAFGGGLSWAAGCLKWYGGGAAGVGAAERERTVGA